MTELAASPVGGTLGVEVRGVDAGALQPQDVEAIGRLLDEHQVVFLPDQHLDDEQHLAFAHAFGAPYVHPLGRRDPRATGRVERIIDSPERPPYQDKWHTDVSWDPEPPTYGTLRAIELPPRGGDTIWVNMYAVFDALSAPMREFLATLQALHTMGSMAAFRTKAGDELVDWAQANFPGALHPLAPVHPGSGRRYLYANAEFTASIDGLTKGESDALLRHLADVTANPNTHLRYRWTVGDLVIWDERCTQHFAVADYLPHRREMARIAVR